jgi:hypothetical protein
MSDFRNDPNFVQSEMREYSKRTQWAAVAALLLLCGGMIIAAAMLGGGIQTASGPAAETTGSGAIGSTAQVPMEPRLKRH